MVKICVFDTETTDVPPNLPGKDWNERSANDAKLLEYEDLTKPSSMWKQMLSLWPSIVQLSYIIYDSETPENSKIFNKYIEITDDVVISESSIAVHHITREKISQEHAKKKALVSAAITEFTYDIINSEVDIVVGHNVQFDRKMIISELLRLGSNSDTEKKQLEFLMNNKNFVCTMNDTAPICNIQMALHYKDKKTGEDKVFYKIKSPKLSEAYFYYFGYDPSGEALHDALIDVILCLRLFMKYKFNEDICGKNTTITDYIKRISPEGYICNLDKAETGSDINNSELELMEEAINENTNSITKRKRGSKNNKKSKTKKRRSKRLAAIRKNKK